MGALSGTVPSLEYKEEGGCWKPAPKKSGPTNRGQRKRWRLDLPAPCKTYKFRFALQSDSCVDYLEHPKTMGGSPQYLVDQSRFLPGAPENLQMGGNDNEESVVAKELSSQFPTLLICLVAGGLLLFLVVVIIVTVVIRRRQRSGVHHVQKS